MTTRRLVRENARSRLYEVLDDAGEVIGTDEEAILEPAELNRSAIERKARQALEANATFLALPTPSNAQVLAQVKALTRQVNGLARLILGELDAAGDT